MDVVIVCLILAALVIFLAAVIENTVDKVRLSRYAKDLERLHHERHQAAIERRQQEAAGPLEWRPPTEHLDLAKLEVTEHYQTRHQDSPNRYAVYCEPIGGSAESVTVAIDGNGYARTTTYDANGNLVNEVHRKIGVTRGEA